MIDESEINTHEANFASALRDINYEATRELYLKDTPDKEKLKLLLDENLGSLKNLINVFNDLYYDSLINLEYIEESEVFKTQIKQIEKNQLAIENILEMVDELYELTEDKEKLNVWRRYQTAYDFLKDKNILEDDYKRYDKSKNIKSR